MEDSMTGSRGMELPNWENRSWVTGSMLNPALIASIIAATAHMFEDNAGDAMPLELAFLSVPMVLHRQTREALPSRVNSHVAKWVIDNATLHATFPARARSMTPYAREGLRYGLRSDALTLIDGDRLSGTLLGKQLNRDHDNELAAMINKAGFLGRWFARTGPAASLFALFGVAP